MEIGIAEKMALVKLQRLHGEVAGAHPGKGTSFLIFFVAGLGSFVATCIIVAVMQLLPNSKEWLPLVAPLVLLFTWIGFAVLLKRDTIRKANQKKAALRQQLSDAVKEIASTSADWVASVGGPDALLDGQRFNDMVLALRNMPYQGSIQPAMMATLVPPQSASEVPGADLLSTDTGAMKLRTCARGFLAGGILNIIVGIIVMFVLGLFCILPLTLGSIELLYASRFWSTPPSIKQDPTWVARLELFSIIIGSGWSFIIGIGNLKKLKSADTKQYLNSLRTDLVC